MKCLFIGQRRLIQTFFFLKSSSFALYSFPCFSLSHFLLLLSVMNIFHLPLCFYCDHVPSSHLVPLAMVSFCHWSNRKYHHALWILDYQLDQQSILLKSAWSTLNKLDILLILSVISCRILRSTSLSPTAIAIQFYYIYVGLACIYVCWLPVNGCGCIEGQWWKNENWTSEICQGSLIFFEFCTVQQKYCALLIQMNENKTVRHLRCLQCFPGYFFFTIIIS